MSHLERDTDPLAQLLRDGAALDAREQRAAREAFLRRVDGMATRAPCKRSRTTWLAPLAAAAAALLVVLAWPNAHLEYEVNGAFNESGYVRVDEGAPATIHFSDATRLTAAPGSRLRIGEVQSNGASVSVEQGRITAHVFHSNNSDWRFVAGPFQVQVTGTRFDLTWDARRERLEVELHEGSVEITGYSGAGPVAVRAGQRFVGDARTRTLQVTDSPVAEVAPIEAPGPAENTRGAAHVDDAPAGPASADSADTGDTGEGPLDEAHLARGAPKAKSHSATTEAGTSWTGLVAQGEFQRVVDEADSLGAGRCLESCGRLELVALADAARYTGRSGLAEQSLLALRKRFPESSGTRAAFLLGRLYEHRGDSAQARTWYETSLRESPNGSFTSESLAGKMRTVNTLEGKRAAAPIARDYLRRYPRGVHASLAKQLASSP